MASLITISQKYQYGVRALYELSVIFSSKKVASLSEIAEKQDIPVRFLELIFAKLKSGGYVQSHRGQFGGYMLAKPPSRITLGELYRFLEGPLLSVNCSRKKNDKEHCKFYPDCVFNNIWSETYASIAAIFDSKTLQTLIDANHRPPEQRDYQI